MTERNKKYQQAQLGITQRDFTLIEIFTNHTNEVKELVGLLGWQNITKASYTFINQKVTFLQLQFILKRLK